MANRVILGQFNGQYGLWVSKAGYNVLSTSDSNYLFNMSGSYLQVAQKGDFVLPSGSGGTINIPLSGLAGIRPIFNIYTKEPSVYGTRVFSRPSIIDVSTTSTNMAITYPALGVSINGSYVVLYEGN